MAITRQGASKPSEAPTLPTVQPSARQIRSIEPDLKMAFDVAINEALAKKLDDFPDAATGTSNTAPAPAPLITKQVKSTPEVAIVPMVGPADEKSARTTTNLNMRQGPGAKFTLVEALPTGTLVAVLKEEAGWAYIRVMETAQN